MLKQLSEASPIPQVTVGVISIVFMLALFLLDILMPWYFASEYLYATVILLGLYSPWRNHLYALAIVTTALTVTGYYLSPDEGTGWIALGNHAICIANILLFTILATKLVRGETEQKSILESAVDGIITINEDGMIESFNPAAERLFGYSAKQILRQNISALMPAPYQAHHNEFIRHYLESGEKKIIGIGREVEGLRKDGSLFPLDLAVSETCINGNRHFVGIVRDISERKNIEKKLRIELEFNEGLINTAKVIILILDEDFRITYFNPYTEQLTGYSLAEVRGKNWVDIFVPESEQAEVRRIYRQAMSGINTQGSVNSIVTRAAEICSIEWFDSPLTNPENERIGTLAIGHDISEREEVYGKLLARTQQLVVLSDLAQQAMTDFRTQSLIDTAINSITNTISTKFVFYMELQADKKHGLIHRDNDSLKHTIEKSLVKIQTDSLFSYTLNMSSPVVIENFQKDERFPDKSGFDEHDLNSGLSILVGTVESPHGVLGVFMHRLYEFTDDDINFLWSVANVLTVAIERHFAETQTKQLQKTLASISRMSAIGELGASIAHELNQPITAMINYAQSCRRLLLSKYDYLPEEINLLIDKTVTEAERAASIIRHLRGYIETGVLNKSYEDLNHLIKETFEQIRIEVNASNITLTSDLQANLPKLNIDKIQIQQVILNLLQNSIEALEEVVRREIIVTTRYVDNNTVAIIVADTGPGVDPNVLNRVFEKAFSVKEHGLGIGLSICKSIIEGHEGTLSCSSTSAGGAEFQIKLPITVNTEGIDYD